MYFFLGNFSLLEILVTMTAMPRMLSDLLTPYKVISFTGCMVQFYFYFSLGSTSFLILIPPPDPFCPMKSASLRAH